MAPIILVSTNEKMFKRSKSNEEGGDDELYVLTENIYNNRFIAMSISFDELNRQVLKTD